jgi:hypothetical protein
MGEGSFISAVLQGKTPNLEQDISDRIMGHGVGKGERE